MHIQSKFYYFFVKIKSIESLCTKVVIVAVKLYYAFKKKKRKCCQIFTLRKMKTEAYAKKKKYCQIDLI